MESFDGGAILQGVVKAAPGATPPAADIKTFPSALKISEGEHGAIFAPFPQRSEPVLHGFASLSLQRPSTAFRRQPDATIVTRARLWEVVSPDKSVDTGSIHYKLLRLCQFSACGHRRGKDRGFIEPHLRAVQAVVRGVVGDES